MKYSFLRCHGKCIEVPINRLTPYLHHDTCIENDCRRGRGGGLEVEKAHQRADWCHACRHGTAELHSSDNGKDCTCPFLRHVCIWQAICSWYKTESAHCLAPYYIRNSACSGGVKVQREHAAFPQSLSWHIVKDSSLIIRWQRHTPASPFRSSWTAEAGVWFLRPCDVSPRIGSCPTGDLIWTSTGVNPTRIAPAPTPLVTRPAVRPLLRAQEKHQSSR